MEQTQMQINDSSSPADALIGNYRKLEDLGIGGYSRVLLAAHKETGDLVAIKILLSEPIEEKNSAGQVTNVKWTISKSKYRQCKREMEIMKRVEHENVVKLIDFMEDATFPQQKDNQTVETPCLCVVLEHCSKGELFDYLMFVGGLGSRVTRTYFHQLLNGLQAMHKAGYVHRDLKPENLLLDDNYNLKIADFGYATLFKENKQKILLSSICGTRGYLAPELIKGERYTHMVDLFAVGIIMFTSFAGCMLTMCCFNFFFFFNFNFVFFSSNLNFVFQLQLILVYCSSPVSTCWSRRLVVG